MSTRPDPILAAPWCELDDAALLAHFRGRRSARFFPVPDAQETQRARIDAVLEGRFFLTGETHRLPDPIDWLSNPSRDIEWHIMLHKFYYAVGLGIAFEETGDARYLQRWITLIDGWIAATPPGFIAADVTGRRVQNWIYSLHHFVTQPAHAAEIAPAFFRRLLHSLHAQVEFLCENLTAKRNHRTLELAAIFLAGVALPELRDAGEWREFALAQTVDNLCTDLLPDGVHCELSTDYHHLVLKNALNFRRLAALNDVAVPPELDAALQRGLDFSLHVHKPDGVVPSLSDGDACDFRHLLRQGAELYGRADLLWAATQGREGTPPAERHVHFPCGGYSVVRGHWGDRGRPYTEAPYLVFDSGPLGEGNHGHFDALSIELAAFGRSLVVDPGRYTYSEAGPVNWRVHFRGTAAHNTVCVDGRNQTRYAPEPVPAGTRHAAGSLRHRIAGPAPRTRLVERHHASRFDLLRGETRSHEYDAVHERCIACVDGSYWIVVDRMRAPTVHDYALRFQLGPAAAGRTTLQAEGRSTLAVERAIALQSPHLVIVQPRRDGMAASLEAGWVSASYGEKAPAPALQTRLSAADAVFQTVLWPFAMIAPALHVEAVAVEALDAASGASAVALRIEVEHEGGCYVDHWFDAGEAVSGRWRVGTFAFSGRWAHWRQDAEGRLQHAESHEGAILPRAEVTA